MNEHIVLLGDSIFDNAPYVPQGETVTDYLQAECKTTRLATDGAVASDVLEQIKNIPADATHLFLSVGGNDALSLLSYIQENESTTPLKVLSVMAEAQSRFWDDYERVLDALYEFEIPITVCTIYTNVPGLPKELRAALSYFNDVIVTCADSFWLETIDLRKVCYEDTDFSPVSPIEPSSRGGRRIADAVRAKQISTHFDSLVG